LVGFTLPNSSVDSDDGHAPWKSSAMMSSNKIAPPTHSRDATQTNHSTNIINHDMNTTSSGRTFTHVNDGQKKRVETHKHRNLKVAPVVHKAMVSHGFLLL
jgi:hypothetical protein